MITYSNKFLSDYIGTSLKNVLTTIMDSVYRIVYREGTAGVEGRRDGSYKKDPKWHH